jgi:hypothetical protein
MIEGTLPRGRPRTKYISQIIKDGEVTSYREFKDMAKDKENWRKHSLKFNLLKTNHKIKKCFSSTFNTKNVNDKIKYKNKYIPIIKYLPTLFYFKKIKSFKIETHFKCFK